LAALKAELAAQRAELAAVRAELAAVRAGAPTPPPDRAPTTVQRSSRWTETDTGAWVCQVGQALTRGEERLASLPWPDGWLIATGFEITDRTRTREVDALVIAPGGVAVVEQKDTVASGRLQFWANGPAEVDGVEVPALTGALRQARLPAQMLSTTFREQGIRAGYVTALLAVHGRVTLRSEQIGGVHVANTADLVRTAVSLLALHDPDDALTAGTVLGLLTAVALPMTALPPLTQIGYPETSW
jgi:hypothetical protein